MFIGERKIDKVSEDGKFVDIIFKDKGTAKIHKELYDRLATEKQGNGTVQDLVNHHLATQFISILAYYNLDYYNVESVSTSMRVLGHNLRENAIGRAFECSGADSIKLDKIIEQAGD